jgi:hypothetical protein
VRLRGQQEPIECNAQNKTNQHVEPVDTTITVWRVSKTQCTNTLVFWKNEDVNTTRQMIDENQSKNE